MEKPTAPQGELVTLNEQTGIRGTSKEKFEYVSADNVKYEWDEEKHAWFPMFDEELVRLQQSVYGKERDLEDTKTINRRKREELKEKQRQERAAQKAVRKNTAIYVNGLPKDATQEEIAEYFKKCGVLMVDFETGLPKIKLYRDDDDNLKGDATIFFFQEASVALACQLLDEAEFRPGCGTTISVTPAKFEAKRDGDGSQNPQQKKRVDKNLVKRRLEQMQRKIGWEDDALDMEKRAEKFRKLAVLKHMFAPEELERQPELILEIKEDIRSECSKFGEVTSVKLFEDSPEGICVIKFKNELSALACVQRNHGRLFGGQQIEAFVYDGSFKLRKARNRESDEKEQERLEKFADWLEEEDEEQLEKE